MLKCRLRIGHIQDEDSRGEDWLKSDFCKTLSL